MVVYADTSFLFSFYSLDANSTRARYEWNSMAPDVPIIFTALQQHELYNALWLSVFWKKMPVNKIRGIQTNIAADIQNGTLQQIGIEWDVAFARAENIAQEHTPVIGCRASDILHVALAQLLGVDTFYSFDNRQRALAQQTGLIVKPNLQPQPIP